MRRNLLLFPIVLLLYSTIPYSCMKQSDDRRVSGSGAEALMPQGPEWAKDANIYEVNIRQYTPEGTFAAFKNHLPRLKEMGVDILWFMPIHPISEKRRKGSLGSYYAISDYSKVNPRFGTIEEFKALVKKIHEMDMRVLMDWVPNHTGWDHAWIEEHPEWYTHDEEGNIIDPINPETGTPHGWTDVAELNYEAPGLREAMIKAMEFWLTEAGIDGYRVDVAGDVPLDFWEACIPRLREINPGLFMLAEAELPEHRNSGLFTMSYGWSFHHLMNDIAQEKAKASAIDKWLKKDRSLFHRGYHMHFITNHDENSWNGTIEERLGLAAEAMAVLAFTFDGMPLIYSGQEAGLDKRLKFFEKDFIEWGEIPLAPFYATLLDLKHRNRALWNGAYGGQVRKIQTGNDDDIYAFYRERGGDKAIVVLNLSGNYQDIVLQCNACTGTYTNLFANSTINVTMDMMLHLNPWDYVVWTNK
jgi:alpha-amylase